MLFQDILSSYILILHSILQSAAYERYENGVP